MRRALPSRTLTAVLLLLAVLWAAATLTDSHQLAWAILVPLWSFIGLVRIAAARRGEERLSEQAFALLAGLSPRAPPAGR